jgi:hypothetical protein
VNDLVMNREALIQEVTEEFIRHCLDRPWLSLTPDQVSAIVVDIVIKRLVDAGVSNVWLAGGEAK